MVETVLRTADPELNVELVNAVQGKMLRAEPVAQLFEAGRILLDGRFAELETELCGMIAGGDYQGPGASPDRADASLPRGGGPAVALAKAGGGAGAAGIGQ